MLDCVIRMRTHLLFLLFFLSQHVRDEKIYHMIIKLINPFLACWYFGWLMPLAERLSLNVYFSDNLSTAGIILEKYTIRRKGIIY